MSEPHPKRQKSAPESLEDALTALFNANPIEEWIPRGVSARINSDDDSKEADATRSEEDESSDGGGQESSSSDSDGSSEEDSSSNEEEGGVSARNNLDTGRSPLQLGAFVGLPEGVLLDIASFLDPHELDDFFLGTCKTCYQLSKCDGAFKVRLSSVLRYFSILKVYADQVDQVVEGGWPVLVKFLTFVAHRVQSNYREFQVHKLHRALIGEQIIGKMCNFQHLLPYHPLHPRITEDDEEEFVHERSPEVPSLGECFELYEHEGEVSGVRLGDSSILGDAVDLEWNDYARANNCVVHTQPPTADSEERNVRIRLHPIATDRVVWDIFPVVFLFRDANEGEIGIGFGGPDTRCQQRIFRWERFEEALDDALTEYSQADWPSSIVASFCTGLRNIHGSRQNYQRQLITFAWLWMHGVGPFDRRSDADHWKEVIDTEENRIRTMNLDDYDDEDPFGSLSDDLDRFTFVRSVLENKVPLALATDYE